MILKQRFQDGRTNYTDIGDDFMYTQFFADGFSALAKSGEMNEQSLKDCMGIIHYGVDKKQIPIYKDFPQWIYSNDGRLFMNLTP